LLREKRSRSKANKNSKRFMQLKHNEDHDAFRKKERK
jgi:hypothetical protein